MAVKNVSLIGGGCAKLGRAIPIHNGLRTLVYETDFICRFEIEGLKLPISFRGLIVGMDEITSEGSTPRGYGSVRFEALNNGEYLLGNVKWYESNGFNKGTITFDGGTGQWKSATGLINVGLNYCLRSTDDERSQAHSGSANGIVLLEGTGQLQLS